MRPDMAKVIVERPRHGSRLATKGKGYDKQCARIAWEDQPKRERMKQRSGGRKFLNEHLAPLRRYLASQVGQSWDKVFADLCRYVNRDSAVQDHLRDHVEDYVAVRTMLLGGTLCHSDDWRVGRPIFTMFYVCPHSGILRKNKNYDRGWFGWVGPGRPSKPAVQFIQPNVDLVRYAKVWCVVAFDEVPDPLARPGVPMRELSRYDVLLRRNVCRRDAVEIYGRPIYAAVIRRAGKREVRAVVNSYPLTNLVR